ncbi:MAG: family 16 glycoside hydrolase, partial [Planctomycetota bacterium]
MRSALAPEQTKLKQQQLMLWETEQKMQRTWFSSLVVAVVCSLFATNRGDAQNIEWVPGVAVQVFQLADESDQLPRLAINQTPNFEAVYDHIDVDGEAPWVSEVEGVKYTQRRFRVFFDRVGRHDIRLTGDSAIRLQIWGGIRGETTISNPGSITTRVKLNNPASVAMYVDQLVIGNGPSSLKLEWRPEGEDEWISFGPEDFETPADPTRVTSPGFKRLANTREPGDGNPVAGVHPAYDLIAVRPPDSKPSVGAMTFLPDGRLIVGTFKPLQRNDVALPDIESKEPDKLYEVRQADATSGGKAELVPVAEGLYEPTGLCVVDGELYVAQRLAITKLTDTDGDGFFETRHDVGKGWEGWNYHQFTFGLVHRDGKLYAALSTAMGPPGWEGHDSNASVNGPMRGGIVEVDLATETTRVIAGGTRTPNTVGLGPDDILVYADNQGTWFPSSVLTHVEPGRFLGHFNRTNVVPKLADRFPIGGHPSAFGEQVRSRPIVYLPHNEFLNSPTKPLMIPEGPFAGQMLLGELTYGGIRRIFLEKVNGQWQGAAFRFTQGLECGVNRLEWGPDGDLYIGGIGGGGNWAWNGTQFGLEKLSYNGKDPFEIFTVSATPDGFHVRFTKPVDKGWLADANNYFSQQWGYEPSKQYGGVKKWTEVLDVSEALPDSDGKGVRLTIPGLKTDRCVYLRMNPESIDGEPIWSTEAFYTLNMIPSAAPAETALLNGQPVFEAGDAEVGLGVGVLPPEDSVALIGRTFEGAMWRTKAERKGLPRTGGMSQDDILQRDPDDGVEISRDLGNLRTVAEFGDQRVHVEWYAPGRKDGKYTGQTGNSGVYIQGRYEVQVLGTPADKPIDDYEPWEAGSIYEVKTPDVNASTGPNTWQAYDIWFRAARFDDDGNKTEDARMTVFWNGQLIHNASAVSGPTGHAGVAGEPVR